MSPCVCVCPCPSRCNVLSGIRRPTAACTHTHNSAARVEEQWRAEKESLLCVCNCQRCAVSPSTRPSVLPLIPPAPLTPTAMSRRTPYLSEARLAGVDTGAPKRGPGSVGSISSKASVASSTATEDCACICNICTCGQHHCPRPSVKVPFTGARPLATLPVGALTRRALSHRWSVASLARTFLLLQYFYSIVEAWEPRRCLAQPPYLPISRFSIAPWQSCAQTPYPRYTAVLL